MAMANVSRFARWITLSGVALCGAAGAQELVIQTLDRVVVNSTNAVLEMDFADPRRDADFVHTGITGSALQSCTLTAIDGLYCLDGPLVRHWADPALPGAADDAVDCRDAALGFDVRAPGPCTALAVDAGGDLWLAGKSKGKSYSVVAVSPRAADGTCPPGFVPLTRTNRCADVAVTGRPLVLDLVPVEGDDAEAFPFGAGILALEERKTTVFFPDSAAPVVLATNQDNWKLQGNEQLQAIALSRLANASGTSGVYLLATTSLGRILAVASGGGLARQVFDVNAARAPSSVRCSAAAPAYGMRASSRSGRIYVTDRAFCQVLALEPVAAGGVLSGLENAEEPVFDASGQQTGLRALTLSTAGSAGTFPPEGPTVAPGISIDLLDCAGSCTLVVAANGEPAATLSRVMLASQESGLTLFQIRHIPDCRYDPQTCRNVLGVQNLVQAGVVVDPQATGDPAAQLLNVTPLLPREVTDLFADTGGLPDMLISRQYRGSKANGFEFDAFFGVTENGVVFRDTFEGEFDVAALTGSELGCALNLPPGSPLFTENAGQPNERIGTLDWDVATTVSERFRTFTDPSLGAAPQFVDTLINSGCGSSRVLSGRWSLKPYNLEITPCTFNGDPQDVWASDGSCPVGGPELPDDAVFAKLVLSLYDDLHAALNQLACSDADGGGAAPLSSASCSTLDATWLNGKDKLDKCWAATQLPKTSAGDQNCQAFLTQFTSFGNTLAGAPVVGPDPANRKGELQARAATLLHVYQQRFVPSIPAGGFVEP
jgi:hypothetical protein